MQMNASSETEMDASSQPDEYFESYGDLEVHKLMLSDLVRNEAYREAIMDNEQMFTGKTVLDVGTGTGFLAILCAKAGAKKVYAVEASDMAELATVTVHENEVADQVEVIQKRIEDVDLPEKVDIIVSEWMGFYLLHESMLDSVIYARDKFLKPDGLMYPYKCTLYTAPTFSPEIFKFWENISGVKMNTIGQLYRTKFTGKPEIMLIDPTNILSKPIKIIEFNIKDIQISDLNQIKKSIKTSIIRSGQINGISLWFDVYFKKYKGTDVVLSTAPVSRSHNATHWKQTVIVLPIEKLIDLGEEINYNLNISKSKENPRHYNIELSIQDAEEGIDTQAEDQNKKQKTEQIDEEYYSGSDSEDD